MLDLTLIREKPDMIKKAVADRNTEAPIDRIVALDERRREVLTEVEALRAERNTVSKEIARMKDQEARQAKIERMRSVGDTIKELEAELGAVEADLQEALLWVPNPPHESVPLGSDESANVLVRQEGEPCAFEFEPIPHWDLGPALGIIDFERGVRMSGTRFYILLGNGARLQRALIQWMLDLHVAQGYTEVQPPYMVRREMMVAAGQLPKYKDNIYHDVEDDFWFIGTAEIPLTNVHREEILAADNLPLNYVAYSPCFRREKMSAGRDVRGMKRGHQFDKVEMYKLTTPETSYDEMEKMLADAEAVCRGLGLAYRILELCTGDIGFHAAKTYDIEAWAPGVEEWLEVSSVSNATDFQARRASIRYRPEPGARPQFVHTLNGSGLALPRTMIAVIENYQQRDGSVVVPEVLRPYMGGVDVIR